MIQFRKSGEENKDSSSAMPVIISSLPSVDLKTSTQMQAFTASPITRKDSLESGSSFYCTNKQNPFADNFSDPLCKVNTKETSDFVKAFSMTTKVISDNRDLFEASVKKRREGLSMMQRRLETPSTPGRPVFSFSSGHLSRKSIPSKWDDAEKWLISSPCHESPAHVKKPAEISEIPRQNDVALHKDDAFGEKQLRVAQEKAPSSPASPGFDGPAMPLNANVAFTGASSDVLLKDKFTDNLESVYRNFRYSEPSKEAFLFKSSYFEPMKVLTTAVASEVQRRDIGTEMTPLGSSTTTRCHTPIKITSPARHNTPANRSGPLVPYDTGIDISELKDCHFAKLELGAQYDSFVSKWSSREEEEEEVSKSLRHLEISGGRKSVAQHRVSAWEEEERTKSCIRYQSEEARIQAWVNLQSAKAEAQSRKLEVKIQMMRSNLEEKLMRRMAIVHRRAEEWRAAAQLQHSQQSQRVSEQAQKLKSHQRAHVSGNTACGCFPCNHHL